MTGLRLSAFTCQSSYVDVDVGIHLTDFGVYTLNKTDHTQTWICFEQMILKAIVQIFKVYLPECHT